MISKYKNIKLLAIYLGIFAIFTCLLLIVYYFNRNNGAQKTQIGDVLPVNEQIKPDTLPNPFDFNKAVVGDVSSGFEILKISSYNGDQIPTIDNLTINFKNKKMINGRLEKYSSGPLQGKVCLYNDDPYSQKSVPRIIGDNRLLFFCFNNVEKATKLVEDKLNESVNVLVDNYTININNSTAVNVADLVD